MWCRLTLLALVFALAPLATYSPPVATAHVANATAGITHDLFTDVQSARCSYGPGNGVLHSFTFASANDTADLFFICAQIYNPNNHADIIKSSCDYDFVRTCAGSTHSPGGPEHCNDQDASMYHAGARNQEFASDRGTTIRRHAIY